MLKVQPADFHVPLVGRNLRTIFQRTWGFWTFGAQPRTIRKILVVDDNIALTFAGSKWATSKRVTQQPMHRRSECRCQGAGEQDESGMPVISPECRGPWDCIAESLKVDIYLVFCMPAWNQDSGDWGIPRTDACCLLEGSSSAAEPASIQNLCRCQNLTREPFTSSDGVNGRDTARPSHRWLVLYQFLSLPNLLLLPFASIKHWVQSSLFLPKLMCLRRTYQPYSPPAAILNLPKHQLAWTLPWHGLWPSCFWCYAGGNAVPLKDVSGRCARN